MSYEFYNCTIVVSGADCWVYGAKGVEGIRFPSISEAEDYIMQVANW